VNRLCSRGWGEKKEGRKRMEEREEGRGHNPHPISPSATSLSARSFSVLPVTVRPFQLEPVHRYQCP